MLEIDLEEDVNVFLGDKFEIIKKTGRPLIDDVSEVGDIVTVIDFGAFRNVRFECSESKSWFYLDSCTELKKITHGT